MSLSQNAPVPSHGGWRWLTGGVWRLERAFERAKAAGRAEDDARIRIFFVLAAFTAGFVTLGVGALHAAVFSAPVRSDGYVWSATSARADLTDRNGNMLAADLLHYGLYVDPREIWDTSETRRRLHEALPDLDPARLEKALKAKKRSFLIGGLTPEVRGRIHGMGLPGLSFENEERRVYPLGETAAHMIGFSDTGGIGLAGAEYALNKQIRDGAAGDQPTALSIDLRVQAALEDELFKAATMHSAIGAVGLVTNIHTGEILALASYPTFDPNAPGKAPSEALINHAAASVYEMGSIMKVFSVAMGLDSGAATLTTTFDTTSPYRLGSRAIRDYHPENRPQTVAEIFLNSSNVGTTRLSLAAGGPTMARYYKNLGFLSVAPNELRESARPIVPRKWDDNTVASVSFGSAIAVSPLSVAAGMGAVMNGGTYVPLTIKPMKPGSRPEGRRVMSETTSRAMLDLMRANVVHGTGGKANAAGLRVGGKTGSSEKVINGRIDRSKLVASFAAVFPTDGPLEADRYFVLVLLDEPKGTKETFGFRTGGWTATPAAGRVINRIGPFLGVTRREDVAAAPVEGLSEALLKGEDH